ncbi:MAG: aminoglycoside phosphotransferase family protein [Flavobacteriaceae bacterium]|nr:aminoglycoside phosphotransferase family protein [Muriicola sp.]NNL40838.1 aminoglycoside phosphotransferase family protein [Flavobacteriaceae bacterium]
MEVAAAKALKHFVIEQRDYKIHSVGQGYINTTYRIQEGNRTLYILQRINHEVFPDVPALMENLRTILPLLAAEDYHPISFMHSKARLPYYKDEEGAFWRLLTYVPNSVAFDFTNESDIAFEAGRILGVFHSCLENIPATSFREVLPGFHDISLRREEYFLALKQAISERLKSASKEIDFAEEAFSKLDVGFDNLPVRICHNDTKLNNILFSKKTGKALCLIDLDTVMPGYIIFDLGDSIRTLANPVSEDETDLKKISFDLDMVSAFLKGIKKSKLKLSDSEKKAIPSGIALMPYLHGLRALTDYLNNDVYYQISYANQNLDRCRNLFCFTRMVLEKKDAISKLVESVLGK